MTYPKNRSFYVLITFFYLACFPVSIVQADEADGLLYYLEQALGYNNDIIAAKARVEASRYNTLQSGVLPDPRFSAQYYIEPVETRTGPQNAAFGLSQTIPWFGKLDMQRERSKSNAAISETRLNGVQVGVAKRVKQIYLEYGFVGQSQKIIRDNVELLNYLENVIRTQYANGKASYGDILKIQIELAKIEDRAKSLKDYEAPIRVQLNSLIGSPPEIARPVPAKLLNTTLALSGTDIIRYANDNSPVLQEAVEMISGARTDLSLAGKNYYPDFTISVKTILTGSAEFGTPPDSGRDPVIAGLSFNLPLNIQKRNYGVAGKKVAIRIAQNNRIQKVRTMVSDIEMALYRYREAGRQFDLYDSNLLPKAKQKLEVTLEAFQGGQHSVLDLMDAVQILLNFELAKVRALSNKALEVARLEELSGVTLTDWTQSEKSKVTH